MHSVAAAVMLAAGGMHATPDDAAHGPIKHADYDDSGPLHLMITYRCDPGDRAAFRTYLEGPAAERLAALEKDGRVADHAFYFNWYVDEQTWDAMLMVRFDEWTDVEHWRAVEREFPGGLCATGHGLATPQVTSSADVVWESDPAAAGEDTGDSVHLLIPYVYLGLVSEYRDYVDGYVIPQLNGWVESGILRTYRVVLNRFPTGDRWKAYLMLEYRDVASFGRRKDVKYAVRERLEQIPSWVEWARIKRTIRTELEPVITERLGAAQ